jgi:hypothetical protein
VPRRQTQRDSAGPVDKPPAETVYWYIVRRKGDTVAARTPNSYAVAMKRARTCEEFALINQSEAANNAEGPARWSA